jgi:hypothetical protein
MLWYTIWSMVIIPIWLAWIVALALDDELCDDNEETK